jgi:hypothetical protein
MASRSREFHIKPLGDFDDQYWILIGFRRGPDLDDAESPVSAQRNRVADPLRRHGAAERRRVGGCPVLALELVEECSHSVLPSVSAGTERRQRAYRAGRVGDL